MRARAHKGRGGKLAGSSQDGRSDMIAAPRLPVPDSYVKPVQRSFLDILEDAPTIAATPAAEYTDGIMPAPIAAALRVIRRASGIRQADMARAFGISRLQLANAEQGRFGLGAAAAAKVREWLDPELDPDLD